VPSIFMLVYLAACDATVQTPP